MSKSLGNGIEPSEITSKYGADILRLWVASADYHADIRISDEILKQLSEVYRKIRNTARYILGNLYDFDPAKNAVTDAELTELDRWALCRFDEVTRQIRRAYDRFEFHLIYHALHNFCTIDMSNFYLDVIKDRLYVEAPDSKVRRAAQTTIYRILRGFDLLIAPIIPFTAEEIWSYMPEDSQYDSASVMLSEMPNPGDEPADQTFMEKWERIHAVRDDALKALEEARAAKTIGKPLTAKVTLYAQGELYSFLEPLEDALADILIVSKATVSESGTGSFSGAVEGLTVGVERAEGQACPRCWAYSDTVGQDAAHPTLCARCAQIVSSAK